MKRTESISSAQVIKKTQPEESDLVILGRGLDHRGVVVTAYVPSRERWQSDWKTRKRTPRLRRSPRRSDENTMQIQMRRHA